MIKLDTSYALHLGEVLSEKNLQKAHSLLGELARGQCRGGALTGWYDWPKKKGFNLLGEIKAFTEDLGIFYDAIIVCGIGGSYAGAKALDDALRPRLRAADAGPKPIVFAGHHLSEAYHLELLDWLSDVKPLVVVISKSGTTLEPSLGFELVKSALTHTLGRDETKNRIIAITDSEDGYLRQEVRAKGYKSFEVPRDVGGRFSVLTAVGLVPLALAGYDIEGLLLGADRLFSDVEKDPAADVLKYALLRHAAFESGLKIEVSAFMEPYLAGLGEWWKQLFGESEGKEERGLFPASLLYSTDLHSLGQYMQDGPRVAFETFWYLDFPGEVRRGVEKRLRLLERFDPPHLKGVFGKYLSEVNAAAMAGTQMAHHESGRPSLGLSLGGLTEFHFGEAFAFFEVAAALSALLLGVNPFDQPGVEAYKKHMMNFLRG